MYLNFFSLPSAHTLLQIRHALPPFKLILQTTSLTRSFFLPKVFFVLVVFIAVGAIYGLLDFKMGSLVAHARVCDTGDTAITLSAGPVLQALYV